MLQPRRVFCVALALACCCAAQEPKKATTTPAPAGAAWVTTTTQAFVGESRVLVLSLPAKVQKDVSFGLDVKPADAVEILKPLEALAGHDIAYLRVRPRVAGDVILEVPVRERRRSGRPRLRLRVGERQESLPMPRIVSPLSQAHLFGEVVIGARLAGRRPAKVQLLLGETVVAESTRYEQIDGLWRLRFSLSANKLPPGPGQLRVVARYPGGNRPRESAAVPVTLVRSSKVRSYESEALAQQTLPRSLGDRRMPRVGNDRRASGGRYTLHISSDPFARVPLETKNKTGQWYQMAVVARGSYAGGAWPTVGVIMDRNTAQPMTQTPLFSEDWHRVVVGRPFLVPKGKHWVGARFLNDRYVRGVLDRNLYLDRIELLPVPWAKAPARDLMVVRLLDRLAGRAVPGTFPVHALTYRQGRQQYPPAETRLLVNGKQLASQRSERPRFIVGSHVLVPGENRLQLVAVLDTGRKVATEPVVFRWEGKGSRVDNLLRFTAAEPGWKGPGQKTRGFERNAPDGHVFRFSSNTNATLALPEDLAGTFDLAVYMRGQAFRGAARARVTLNDKELKVLPAGSSWSSQGVGRIQLKQGPKHLGVAFINDAYEKGKGDRNLSFGAFELRAVDPRPDQTGPAMVIRYPRPGARVGPVDAVVVDVTDPAGMRDVMLLADGRPVPGVFESMASRVDSRVCLPFTDRRLTPGKHRLQVLAHDRFGRRTTSAAVEVEVTADPKASPYAAAVHFLDRFAYGPEPQLLAEVLVGSPAATLRRALAERPDRSVLWVAEQRFPQATSNYHVSRRVLDMARRNRNPIRTRLLLFWENHFSTWIRKVGAAAEWQEYLQLQEVASARFGRLLRTSAQSPAMMRYLDNQQSFAGRINENYAREIMELHTLGVRGGYTQKDVESLTRVLTGWSSTRDGGGQEFAFLAGLHDRSQQTVVGYRVAAVPRNATGERAWTLSRDRGEAMLEVLLAHPATAHFVA
ncbi:MAG: DUF1800 family protein, partial [Planctomycetota bacterium]